jgi:hypothetical protein
MKSVIAIELTAAKETEFRLRTSEREYVLKGETEEDRTKWVNALENARK